MRLMDRIVDDVIAREGGYVDNPDDSGGPTMYGITLAVARENGWGGPMRDLPLAIARDIIRSRYWDANRLSDIARLSEAVAEEVADTGVNCGVYRAAEFLQRSLNVLNRKAKDYPDVKVDGNIGPRTLDCLRRYLDVRKSHNGERVLLRALNCLQGAFYVELAERRVKDESFVFGWLANRVVI